MDQKSFALAFGVAFGIFVYGAYKVYKRDNPKRHSIRGFLGLIQEYFFEK